MRKLNTKNCCFLCLKSNKIKIGDHNGNSAFHPMDKNLLRCLVRHLKINLNEIETDSSNSNIQSRTNSDVEVDLCEDCAQLNSRFSKLFLQLEKIQMEMNFYLGRIHRRILESSKNLELVQNYSKEMTRDRETLSQLAFVDKLRKEIADKSSRLASINPTVYLTPTELAKVITVKQEAEEIEDVNHFEDHNSDGCSPTFEDSPEQLDFEDSSELKSEVTSEVEKVKRVCSNSEKCFTKNLSTGLYHCIICRKEFKRSDHVRIHHDAVHLKKTFPCDKCSMSFSRYCNLSRHKKRTCKRKAFAGNKIQRKNVYYTRNKVTGLTLNVQEGKGNVASKEKYYTKNPTSGHFHCNSCNKPFKDTSTLNRHYKSLHLGIKKFKCDICNAAAFSHRSSLRKHKTFCNGETPVKIGKRNAYFTQDEVTGVFQCTKCKKQDRSINTIVAHFESIHLQKHYKCDICNLEKYVFPGSLTAHKKICRETLEERLKRKKEAEQFAFLCKLCGKRFPTNRRLKKHQNLNHSNIRRYACDLCDKNFKSRQSLRIHRDKAHFGKRFECQFCRKNCYNIFVQKRHERDCPRKKEVKIESSDKNVV